jgi:multidrug resistance protein, MATE family
MSTSLQVETNYTQIWKIALPISLALLVPQLNLIINNVFLGHYSESSLAIASITGVYYLIFGGIGYGLNNGLQMLISRRAGENRPAEIGKIFTQGVFIALSIATVGILLTLFVSPFIFKTFLPESQSTPVINFLKIRILGLPFLYIYQMRNALLVGINQSKYLVAGTLAETIANIFFDYALIYGKFGFPEIGFNGAAIASIIAEFTGMFVIFMVLRQKGITKTYALFQSFHIDKDNAQLILRIAGPLIFQHAISIISWFFFYMLVARNASQTGLAISTTMRTVFGFFGTFIWALASTTNTMVSNVIGQGKKEHVVKLVNKIMILSISIAAFVFIVLNVFPHFYLSLFRTDANFIKEGIPVIRTVAVAMLFMSFGTIWLNAVTGTGNSRVTFLIELVAIIFYCIYVFMVLEVFKLGILWGWMSELLYWTILFLLSYFYIRSNKWKKLTI